MLWAACCLAFFVFVCVSEFTTPNLTDYNLSVHLSLQDVSIDNRENPGVLKVNIKQSKTDPFWQGIQIYLGATNSDVRMPHIWHPSIPGKERITAGTSIPHREW